MQYDICFIFMGRVLVEAEEEEELCVEVLSLREPQQQAGGEPLLIIGYKL